MKRFNHDTIIKLLLAICLVLFAVSFRLLPHPPNFTPIAALAIFGGTILPRRWALSLPLAAMIASDLIIGMHSLVWVTWGSFLLIALASSKYIKRIKPTAVLGASLGASLFFFVTTNLAVWFQGWLYPLTTGGLISCYYNALPFFRNTLMGDLVFSGALFGSYFLIYRYILKGEGQLKIATEKS